MLRLPSVRGCLGRPRELWTLPRLQSCHPRSLHLSSASSSLPPPFPRPLSISLPAFPRHLRRGPVRSSAASQPRASFATQTSGGKDSKGEGKGDRKEGTNPAASAATSAAPDASSPATTAPVPVKGKSAQTPPPVSLTRDELEQFSQLLSAPPTPPSSRPLPLSSSSPLVPAAAPSLSRRPSLRIPLTPGSDVVDPSVATLVRRSSPDDLIAEQLIDTPTKVVATPAELAGLLQQERGEERSIRAGRRHNLRSRRSLDERVKFSGEEAEYVYDIDENNENEELIADNPESMRRRHAIDLKQVRLNVRERLMELEEADDSEKDLQTAEAERERRDSAERLIRLEAGEQVADDVDSSHYDPMRRVREEEAAEALAAARLRENAVVKYREDFGEREGDDFPFEEEERLYEVDDRPRPPPPKRENIKAKLRPREVDMRGRSFGYGGRKSSIAQVWIQPGKGDCRVNHLNHAEYFQRYSHRACLLRPFEVADRMGAYDVRAFTSGGGKTGQSGAIQLGIARALVKQEPLLRERLKEEGMLTRDPRKVERKKPGQPKARKQYTFVKR